MSKLLNFAIPPEIIESWMKGEYLIGTEKASGYNYIGWALMLRGIYMYEVYKDVKDLDKSDKKGFGKRPGSFSHWGYNIVDLKEGDLYFSGIRLHSDTKNNPKEANEVHPLFWSSVFSKFHEKFNSLDLYLAYNLYKNSGDQDNSISTISSNEIRNDLFKNYLDKNGKVFPKKPKIFDDSSMKKLVGYLCDKLDDKIDLIETDSKETELRGTIRLNLLKIDKNPKNQEISLVISGPYGGYGLPLMGEIRFHKLKEELLSQYSS